MKRLQKWLPGLLIFAVLLTSMLGGAAYAKYTTQLHASGSVNINANLGTINILESKANRNGDGSYTLDTNNPVTSNSYLLLPGLDIPKDPYVTAVVNAIPVYIFVEIVSSLDGSAVSYEIDDENWMKISDVPNNGKHGGTVFVYIGDGNTAKQVSNEEINVSILQDKIVKIGEDLKADGNKTTGLGLTFYACMGQVAAGKDQNGNISITDVYNNA